MIYVILLYRVIDIYILSANNDKFVAQVSAESKNNPWPNWNKKCFAWLW